MLYKMDPEWKQRWLTALRSGEYQQDKVGGMLLNPSTGGYCCLGVLCDVVAKAGQGEWTRQPTDEHGTPLNGVRFATNDDPFGEAYYLSAGMQKLTGVTELGNLQHAITTPKGEEAHSLSGANDEGVSFAQIADIIEEQL